jgi:hypothetical protein
MGFLDDRVCVVTGADCAAIGQIQAKSPAGPEAWPMEGIVDYHVPPVETPFLGSLGLMPGLPKDTFGVLDDLVRADRTVD